MYYIEKTFEISACHRLTLPYESKCTRMHGHNWTITVCCKSKELNSEGMVADFTTVKQTIMSRLDHQNLNSGFCQCVSRGRTGKSAAHDDYIKSIFAHITHLESK